MLSFTGTFRRMVLKQIYKVGIFFDLLLYRSVMNVGEKNPRGSFLSTVKFFKIKRSVY